MRELWQWCAGDCDDLVVFDHVEVIRLFSLISWALRALASRMEGQNIRLVSGGEGLLSCISCRTSPVCCVPVIIVRPVAILLLHGECSPYFRAFNMPWSPSSQRPDQLPRHLHNVQCRPPGARNLSRFSWLYLVVPSDVNDQWHVVPGLLDCQWYLVVACTRYRLEENFTLILLKAKKQFTSHWNCRVSIVN
jgi:hypothetical protein